MVPRQLNAILLLIAVVLTGPHVAEASNGCGESCGQFCSSSSHDTLVIFVGAWPDVGKWGKFPELCQHFQRCGVNARFFEPWDQLGDVKLLASWIRHAVRCRGQRVMLVCWSRGTITGLNALKKLEPEGVCIDTFVEIDCFNVYVNTLGNVKRTNVRRNVIIRSRLNKEPTEYGRGRYIFHHLDNLGHLESPRNPRTKCIVRNEIYRFQNLYRRTLPAVQPVVPLEPAANTSALPVPPASGPVQPQAAAYQSAFSGGTGL